MAQGKFHFFIFYKKREDACKRFKILPGFEFRLREAGAQAAAWSAAESVQPVDVESQQAAAATVGLEEYAWACAASDLLDVKVSEEGNYLQNSDVLENASGMHALN